MADTTNIDQSKTSENIKTREVRVSPEKFLCTVREAIENATSYEQGLLNHMQRLSMDQRRLGVRDEIIIDIMMALGASRENAETILKQIDQALLQNQGEI